MPERRRGRPPRAGSTVPPGVTASRPEDDAPVREARGARRRRETRTRLLSAALRLMADRGMDAVAVNEITEQADVGFGSFYNHFESKEAIYSALIEQFFEEFGDALDDALAGVTDPAEVIAASVRHTLQRARQDGTWARFLLREGLSGRVLTGGLGARLLRDIHKGIGAGRFKADDALMTFLMLSGSALAALAVDVQYRDEGVATLPAQLRRTLKLPCADLPERAATSMLRILGIPDAEARRIARRRLAPLKPGGLASG
jgi:AcrR family transcriptional regulator